MHNLPETFMWLWYGFGFLGLMILLRNPEKMIIEKSFWGSMLTTAAIILVPLGFLGGPITIIIVMLLPGKKLCPHCYKAFHKEKTTCPFCGKSMILQAKEPTGEIINSPTGQRFSNEVQAAVAKGVTKVNLPIPFIMLGVFLGAAAIGTFLLKSTVLIIASLPMGFISSWLWWSYSVPRWRKWALQQPGVTPDELQSCAEIALLVWPKGHFFEKTEFKIKD